MSVRQSLSSFAARCQICRVSAPRTHVVSTAHHFPTRVSSSPIPRRWTSTKRTDKKTDDAIVQHPIPKALAIGSFAGMLGSLAGMGGGFVMIPLMTSSIRLSQHAAHGTSLFAVAATGLAGALSYSTADVDIELDSAAALAACAMVTARAGALMTSRLSERKLKLALGVFMLAVAPLVPMKEYFAVQDVKEELHVKEGESDSIDKDESSRIQRLAVSGTIGLGSGFLAGMFGVGGGAVVVPALTVATDMSHYQALGTSLLAMTLPACVGTITHYQKGNVAMRIAPALALGAFAGAFVGGKVGCNVEESKLRWGFSGLMTFLGLRTILKA